MLAPRELLAAAQDIRDGFGLGLRGTWILGLVATGRVAIQADVVKRYKVARSIIAEEVALLTKASLVACEPLREDCRQIALRVTKSGTAANGRMGDAMATRMAERLNRYTRADLMFAPDHWKILQNHRPVRRARTYLAVSHLTILQEPRQCAPGRSA
jgi:hypothetical protein